MSVMKPSMLISNTKDPLVPSSRMLRAAVSGLLALSAGACTDDEGDGSESSGISEDHDHELSDKEVTALCKNMVSDAVDEALADQDVKSVCSDMVADAKKEAEEACAPADSELPKLCDSMVATARTEIEADMNDLKDKVKKLEESVASKDKEITTLKEKARPLLVSTEEKTTNAEQKEYKYSELTEMCDKRGGYTQIHAACGGHNACAGFSYGDWGPGAAMLTEHSCTGVNGCLGLSCVELPKDAGRSGKEIYEEVEFPEPLNNCGGCHGGYYDDAHKWTHDSAYFAVYVLKDSPRNADNWLDRSPREQELITAFGARSVLQGGTAIQNMAEYHGVLSRAETERVVAHIRTLKPAIVVTKIADP